MIFIEHGTPRVSIVKWNTRNKLLVPTFNTRKGFLRKTVSTTRAQ